MFLPCDPHWWREPRASAIVQSIDSRTAGKRVAEKQWGGGMPGWKSIFHAGAAPTRTVVHEEPPWRRERPGVLLSAGLFPCLLGFVRSMFPDQWFRALLHYVLRKILCFVAGAPTLSSYHSWTSDFRWKNPHLSGPSSDSWRWSAWCPAFLAKFHQEPVLYSAEFLLIIIRIRT